MSAQRGQIFRKPTGLWAVRWRDAEGHRRQRTGFRTKAEAREVLEEELRRVRLGPLHRPNATLGELTDAYVAQYDAAPSTVTWLRDNMRPALERFGDEPIGVLTVQQVATWRASVPEGKRYRSHRALRQVLQAAVRWRWIEDNPAVHVKNPEPRAGEIDPFGSWEELDAIAAELDLSYGSLVVFLAGTGVRPEEAFGAEWRDVDLERRMLMVRRAFAKGRLKEYGKTAGSRRAVPLRARVVTALEALPTGAGSCSRRRRVAGSRSTTSAAARGRRRSRRQASSTGASTTCATPTRRGASRRAWTSSRWRVAWARA